MDIRKPLTNDRNKEITHLHEEKAKEIKRIDALIKLHTEQNEMVKSIKEKILQDNPAMDPLAAEISAENMAQKAHAQKVKMMKEQNELSQMMSNSVRYAQAITKKAQAKGEGFFSTLKNKMQEIKTKKDQGATV